MDDDCKVRYGLENPIIADGFGEVEIVNEIDNEHMHARISHHSVDEHYVEDMCGLFFETRIDCANMISVTFYETLNVEATTIVARYAVIGTAHEEVCHITIVVDQEYDKVIGYLLMRISTDHIIVEDSFREVEKKVENEEAEQKDLTKESHIIDVFNIVLEYVSVQNNMGEKVENKVVNKFEVDWKLIEECMMKPIEQIDVGLKEVVGIKELNVMVNNDLECADYREKETIPDDESENNDMDASEDKYKCIETIFQQWSQEEIRFCFQEIWKNESHEYEVKEVNQRR